MCPCCRRRAAAAPAKALRALAGRFEPVPVGGGKGAHKRAVGPVKLSERLGRAPEPVLPEAAPVAVPVPSLKPVVTPRPEPVQDALLTLKSRVGETLFERLGSRMNDPNLTENDLLTYAREALTEIVEAERVPLSNEERHRLVREISDDVLGYGPLQPLLDDPSVSEIMVNGPDMIFVERAGKLTLTTSRFRSRGAAAPGDREDRLPRRPPHRRVLAARRRAARGRLPRERDHPAARGLRLHAHDPQVLGRTR